MNTNWIHLSIALLSLSVVTCSGCAPGGDGYRKLGEEDDVVNTAPAHEHHHDEGPHGGHILEFGKYHGEIVVDDSRAIQVYILGDDASSPAPVADATVTLHLKNGDQQVEIALTASPLEGEADGQSSRFVAAAESIPETIKDIEDVEGTVELKTGDESASAKISHDHDHDHDHDH